ncbi:YtxH domain-containing protein [Paenibacillus sp. J2TS4]|uniref:YtxH domain-containing protein n=1 Tax=Paenibacillus sp. J2TS4 TaxID=2807194 RepID=UPI001B2D48E3|nr:YtxH domain-containing protein [Paenibacillus sp. J2TS4]GIP34051.1 hypothetical protein J2TS4_32610 [Paenibacillus sp. J2TS4]
MARNGVWVGTMIGAAVGAAGALLLAPKSGAEMRQDIAKGCRTVTTRTRKAASQIGRKTQDIASSVATQTAEVFDKAKQAAAATKTQASEVMEQTKEATQNVMKDVKANNSSKADQPNHH